MYENKISFPFEASDHLYMPMGILQTFSERLATHLAKKIGMLSAAGIPPV